MKGPLDLLSVSPDGRRIAAGGPNQPPTVWELANDARGQPYQANNRIVRQIAFGADGRSLLLGFGDNVIRVWRFSETLESRRMLTGHQKGTLTLGFSPDGKLLASGSADHAIKLWDVETGRDLLTLQGHDQAVTSVTFFAESDRLASVGLDGKVISWAVTREGPPPGRISARKSLVHAYRDQLLTVTISADEEQLATAGTNGQVHVWNLTEDRSQSDFPELCGDREFPGLFTQPGLPCLGLERRYRAALGPEDRPAGNPRRFPRYHAGAGILLRWPAPGRRWRFERHDHLVDGRVEGRLGDQRASLARSSGGLFHRSEDHRIGVRRWAGTALGRDHGAVVLRAPGLRGPRQRGDVLCRRKDRGLVRPGRSDPPLVDRRASASGCAPWTIGNTQPVAMEQLDPMPTTRVEA